jgi:hypothetical protein
MAKSLLEEHLPLIMVFLKTELALLNTDGTLDTSFDPVVGANVSSVSLFNQMVD